MSIIYRFNNLEKSFEKMTRVLLTSIQMYNLCDGSSISLEDKSQTMLINFSRKYSDTLVAMAYTTTVDLIKEDYTHAPQLFIALVNENVSQVNAEFNKCIGDGGAYYDALEACIKEYNRFKKGGDFALNKSR